MYLGYKIQTKTQPHIKETSHTTTYKALRVHTSKHTKIVLGVCLQYQALKSMSF